MPLTRHVIPVAGRLKTATRTPVPVALATVRDGTDREAGPTNDRCDDGLPGTGVNMSNTRTLVLMRHAKSAYPGGVNDHDRPLAGRGEHQARLAGDWLRAELPPIDEVLTSTSVRTRQTVAAAQVVAPVRLAAEIYEATPDDILEQVRETASAVRTLLAVGHAPGVPGLASELAGPGSNTPDLEALRARFPTAAMAVLQFDVDWQDLDLAGALLTMYHVPRD